MGDYVLIVDDDPDVLVLVRDVVEMLGLPGREALDGQIALDMASADPPRAIVLDLMMPVLDGYGLIDALQATAAGRAIPIILLSAVAENNDMALRELPGVVGVLAKGDFSHEKLRALLKKALR